MSEELDPKALEAASQAVAALHHRMAAEVKVPGYSLILPTAIRAYLAAAAPSSTPAPQADGVSEPVEANEIEAIANQLSGEGKTGYAAELKVIASKVRALVSPPPVRVTDAMVEALKWYAEHVEGCRKIGSVGDPFRHALDHDGGKRARAALLPTEATKP